MISITAMMAVSSLSRSTSRFGDDVHRAPPEPDDAIGDWVAPAGY
jgi:hypothetical protein